MLKLKAPIIHDNKAQIIPRNGNTVGFKANRATLPVRHRVIVHSIIRCLLHSVIHKPDRMVSRITLANRLSLSPNLVLLCLNGSSMFSVDL